MGLAQVPEGRRVFAQQTVEENLLLGAYARKDKDGIQKDLDHVYELFPRLLERKKQPAGTLSGACHGKSTDVPSEDSSDG